MKKEINLIPKLDKFTQPVPHIFISSVNFEERCTAIPISFVKDFEFTKGILFIFEEKNEDSQKNLDVIKQSLSSKSRQNLELIYSFEGKSRKPIFEFCKLLSEFKTKDCVITLDITTLPKQYLLSILKVLDDFQLWKKIQIYYAEPAGYETELYLPMSLGLGNVSSIGNFIGSVSSSLPILLIEFLGYEGDRANSIYEEIDPDETIMIIPKPAYRQEWEGKTEELNGTLIKMIGGGRKEFASAIEPKSVVECLENLTSKFPLDEFKWIVVPLGTKPQTLGLYLFWRNHPNAISILYANPLKNNPAFSSKGVGVKRLLFKNFEMKN